MLKFKVSALNLRETKFGGHFRLVEKIFFLNLPCFYGQPLR